MAERPPLSDLLSLWRSVVLPSQLLPKLRQDACCRESSVRSRDCSRCDRVARAPPPDLRALAPYLMALIDAEEGFRMMGHGDKRLKIGDAVVGRVVRFADRPLPYFEPQRL